MWSAIKYPQIILWKRNTAIPFPFLSKNHKKNIFFFRFPLVSKQNFANTKIILNKLFHDGGRYHVETSPLLCKSMDWFLYDNGLRPERVNIRKKFENDPVQVVLSYETCLVLLFSAYFLLYRLLLLLVSKTLRGSVYHLVFDIVHYLILIRMIMVQSQEDL